MAIVKLDIDCQFLYLAMIEYIDRLCIDIFDVGVPCLTYEYLD